MYRLSHTLYAFACTTGINVDSGADVVETVSVFQGYALSHAAIGTNVGDVCTAEYFMKVPNKEFGPF